MYIRLYHPDDLNATIVLFLRSIREIAARNYSNAQTNAWAQVDRKQWALRRVNSPTWVAVIDETIAGFADLEPDGHIDMMYVHPDYQHRGVARALLRQIEEAAHNQGILRIFTEASITARPFFEKHGFRIITQQVVEVRGQELMNYPMDKSLKI